MSQDIEYMPLPCNEIVENCVTDFNNMIFQGYRYSIFRSIIYWFLVLLSLGFLELIFYWKPTLKIRLKMKRCNLKIADYVIIIESHGDAFVQKTMIKWLNSKYNSFDMQSNNLANDNSSISDKYIFRYIDHKHVRYVWDDKDCNFIRLKSIDSGYSCTYIHDTFSGMSDNARYNRMEVFDKNCITINVKSYFQLLFEEILNPFYIFQFFSLILWFCESYYYYACCIIIITCISIGLSLYQTKKQSLNLRDMAETNNELTIEILNDKGEKVVVSVTSLVPGDVIVLPRSGLIMTCDAVLVAGNAIVNESMLTGESVPVTKTSISVGEGNEIYSPETHKLHTIFSGTTVIQTRFYGDSDVKAVVVRTGFSTAKGELICSILFPKPVGFKFYEDSMKFIGALGCLALIGMIYSIVNLIILKMKVSVIILRALDIITIVVPPSLPAAMTIGTIYAQSRLRKQNIFCLSPNQINICGKLKLVCFDKTGTLTEDGLDLFGILPAQGRNLAISVMQPDDIHEHNQFIIAMATCHSLTIIDGNISGDPLDLIMFNSTNWVLEEAGSDSSKFDSLIPTIARPVKKDVYSSETKNDDFLNSILEMDIPFEVGILKQFAFSSSLQRMSVITRTLTRKNMELFCKGAPEKIVTLCDEATIPDDFQSCLKQYAKRGFRVIAVAWKPLDKSLTWHHIQKISREKLEYNLTFLGLLIMENRLKQQTTPVIAQLNKADIRTVMITGDNILTALSVARQCGITPPQTPIVTITADQNPIKLNYELYEHCDHESLESESNSHHEIKMEYECNDIKENYCFALSGKTYSIIKEHFEDLLPKIVTRGAVFARMKPEQKSEVVKDFQNLGFTTGFCGDGANDCAALKMANAGISLSEAEASVAAPFTSNVANIECVVTLIREGRAALITSFGMFKYMALYSITQFVSVLILYAAASNLGDMQYLYIDLCIITVVAVLMGHTGSFNKLAIKRPQGSLFSPIILLSIFLHILLVIAFQVCALIYLESQPWYVKLHPLPNGSDKFGFETNVIFCSSAFQYINLAFIFSKGKPYRLPVWTNYPFSLYLFFLNLFTIYIFLKPPKIIMKFLNLVVMDDMKFKLTLIGMAGIYVMLALIVEDFLINIKCLKKLLKCGKKHNARNVYKTIENELKSDMEWPPIDK